MNHDICDNVIRLQSGPCDRCRETEEQMKKTQAVFENLPLLNELRKYISASLSDFDIAAVIRSQLLGEIFYINRFELIF